MSARAADVGVWNLLNERSPSRGQGGCARAEGSRQIVVIYRIGEAFDVADESLFIARQIQFPRGAAADRVRLGAGDLGEVVLPFAFETHGKERR